MQNYEEIMMSARRPVAVAGHDTPLDECLYIKGRLYSQPALTMFSGAALNETWPIVEPDLAA